MRYAIDDMQNGVGKSHERYIKAHEIYVTTRVHNPARKLYESFNFELDSQDTKYCYYIWKRNPIRTFLWGY